jgi:hypothetical protein
VEIVKRNLLSDEEKMQVNSGDFDLWRSLEIETEGCDFARSWHAPLRSFDAQPLADTHRNALQQRRANK